MQPGAARAMTTWMRSLSAKADAAPKALRLMHKVAEPGGSATCDATPIFKRAYGAIHVAFRAGMNPAGISAISFIDWTSTAETLLVCSLAT